MKKAEPSKKLREPAQPDKLKELENLDPIEMEPTVNTEDPLSGLEEPE